MKTTIWRYGLRAAIVMIALAGTSFILTSGDSTNYRLGEVIGYLSMVLSMIFVYLGIRHYRDHQNEGEISFTKALKLGVLIALFPATAFGIFDQIYVNIINPDFHEEYYQAQLDKIDQSDPQSYQAEVAHLKSEKETFSNPVVLFLVMFLTVFLVGLAVSIISGLILKRQVRQ